jgi:uncharacterized protein YdaU (DUF1376 family)
LNYYRRYVGDFQRDTGHLSLTHVGAYDRLLDHYYATEGALPDEIDVLCRICRAVSDQERAAVREIVDHFFPVWKDKKRHNNRADHELAVSRQARENGKEGGRPRKTGDPTGAQTGIETGSITGDITGKGAGSGQPPTTNHQPPASSLQPPASSLQEGQPPASGASPAAARSSRKSNGKDHNPKTAATWDAYRTAYASRYGTPPVRNATVNAQLAGFVKRIGAEESPGVAAFYVGHSRGLYVSAKHAVNLLLRDAEGLRTEWATGSKVTDTQARQSDQTATTGAVFQKLIAEADG